MSMEKILKTGAASAIILTATAGSLCKDITIANAGNIDKTGVVNTSALNVRKGPSTKNGIVTKIYKGDKVTITDSSNGWYKVKLSNGKTGWVSDDYIKVSSSSSSSTSSKTGTVTATSLNVRSGAGTKYSKVGSLSKGSKVTITETKNNWHKIKMSNGKTGWASADYIKTATTSSSSTNKADKIVALAKKQLGKPYAWGAEGPNSFDCSGLTYYVYKQNGITLPRSSKAQSQKGTTVSKSNLKAGDLVFFNTNGSGVSHVGIYIGDGNMIHSTKPGDVVKTTSINSSYYKNKFVTAKRYL